MKRDDDHDLDELGALAPLDVDPATAERIRLRARAELARAARPIPIRRALHRAYQRSELVLVGALAASFLALALRAALVPFG
ncbi:MAG TPA: hypothetical protein VFU21_21980 [Kofleriaceae bacterium]|nr:hypothetical protein [Kofleriaceae bacterium]